MYDNKHHPSMYSQELVFKCWVKTVQRKEQFSFPNANYPINRKVLDVDCFGFC